MHLDEIRRRINTIDFEILKLLNSRMEYAIRTKALKPRVADESREDEVIRYIERHSRGLIEPEFCRNLFANIIAESKRLQVEDCRLIGFQGEHGSFSEVAARKFDPELIYISCDEHRDTFEAVESGVLDLGIVPVEHTLGGAVTEVNDALINTDLVIVGEVKLPVSYCFMVLPDTDPAEVRVAFSHRQAISQCQGYLREKNLESRPFYDSAAAARMLVKERPEGSGAIASSFAAEFFNLEIVDSGIEDRHENISRFLILSKDGGAGTGDKCSIIFVGEHRAGALYRVLKEFADAEINLTRIESLPSRDIPGNYVFFLDFQGSNKDPKVTRVLSRVEEMSLVFKFLGCYPTAKPVSTGR
jgi:prephenate dehydratase/chorismate mutase/prephenate dehydratase